MSCCGFIVATTQAAVLDLVKEGVQNNVQRGRATMRTPVMYPGNSLKKSWPKGHERALLSVAQL